MNKNLMEILVCPVCKGKLLYSEQQKELICYVDRLAYPIREEIPIMLFEESRSLNDTE